MNTENYAIDWKTGSAINLNEHLAKVPFIQEVSKLNGNYIAVHIRWTDKVDGWLTEADFYDVDVYFKYALQLREKYGTNNIVLNCDNIEALNKFLSYNVNNKLNFTILYDTQENLPLNDWKECFFQKWTSDKNSVSTKECVDDLLNGFKIYKTIFEADSVVCNYFSNMAFAPCLAKNCNKDINISHKPPFFLFPAGCRPRDSFSENVRKKREESRKHMSKL